MLTVLWGAKGGAGTTFVATSLAQATARRTLLVDLDGDAALMLGLDGRERPGVVDWLTSDAPPAHLADVVVDVPPSTKLLPATVRGAAKSAWRTAEVGRIRWEGLRDWCDAWSRQPDQDVVVDAGTGQPPAELLDCADHRLLVTRRCYLSVMRAIELAARPTGIVLVDERGRSLRADDIARAVGAPIVATLSHDLRVARAIDAGLLVAPAPRAAGAELARVTS